MSENVAARPRGKTRDVAELASLAQALRRQVIRLVAPTGQGYVQQGLGAADLFAALYFSELRLDPANPRWEARDRFLLSTAHNTAIFYATLAARGLIAEEGLAGYCQDGSPLEINASERIGPAIEATCGSLGQGLSVGLGMALSDRRHGNSRRTYVMLGDGEMQEGQVWEAAMAAAAWRLANICVIVDDNRMQADGDVEAVMPMGRAGAKWAAFDWNVISIDGHDIPAILRALDEARAFNAGPTCILARTIVGKGARSLEGIFGHTMKLPAEVAERALAELAGEA